MYGQAKLSNTLTFFEKIISKDMNAIYYRMSV